MSTIALYISQASRVTRRLDRVALAIVLLAAAIALLLPDDRAAESFRFTAASLIWIAPFLVASALAAAYLGAAGADTLISRVFQGRPVAVIVAAALFGGLSPFCSCGVIPLIAALLAAGEPLPAVMAIWLPSPIMDPEMYVLTAGGLGVQFATAKTIAAVGIGLFGGFATLAVVR
ncbi:MAG: permease, partial [Alphaproteobacteria bacterium]